MKSRILEISHKHGLSHIGSNLTVADCLAKIFPQMGSQDISILSCGHAGIALYAALEKYRFKDAYDLYQRHGCQPHLAPADGIYCTTGSLGQGLTVAVGYGLADLRRQVHCLISDGECAEGCVWEALAFINTKQLFNVHVHVNMNGYSALYEIDRGYLRQRLRVFLPRIKIYDTTVHQYPFLRGVNAHYRSMTDQDYESTRHAD